MKNTLVDVILVVIEVDRVRFGAEAALDVHLESGGGLEEDYAGEGPFEPRLILGS